MLACRTTGVLLRGVHGRLYFLPRNKNLVPGTSHGSTDTLDVSGTVECHNDNVVSTNVLVGDIAIGISNMFFVDSPCEDW